VSETHPPRALVDKIWDDHVVGDEAGAPTVLGIDLHLVQEVTSPQAFTGPRDRGLAGPPAGPDRGDRRSLDPDP
jgi:3-isopropylmalate dehydratase large subunit